ncbi:carbohydrate-binding protein [Gynuella sp.]|uniref:carbohydrate-binding protein n=1 Tax=Gynuella sp. TaxID=2969146 RepID=UPI003D0F55F4
MTADHIRMRKTQTYQSALMPIGRYIHGLMVTMLLLVGFQTRAEHQEVNAHQLLVQCQSENFCIIHYQINDGIQQNVQMENKGNGRFEYVLPNLSSADRVSYSFTYQENGLAYDSQQQSHVFSGGINDTPAEPYLGFPLTIPGTVAAENYDRGGEGSSYHDTTSGNTGDEYRTDDVDIQTSSSGGFNIGWISPGEWLQYTVNVKSAGTFDVSAKIATTGNGGRFRYEISGATTLKTDTISFSGTGDWQNWKETTPVSIKLNAGIHTLRVVFESGEFNFHSFDIRSSAYGVIEAEAYDDMQGIERNNAGIGYFDAGDWIKYRAINFGNQARSISLKVAGEYSNGIAQLRLDSPTGPMIAQYTMTPTGGWGNYQSRSFNIQPTSGVHDLYLVGKSGSGIFDLDNFKLSSTIIDDSHHDTTIKAMSLNVYGWATMPKSADAYANLIHSRDVDVVGIQEGVEDWMIGPGMPTDYSKANALGAALGSCWQQQYQIFINTCKGNRLIASRRFDMTDGPHATRTGESVKLVKDGLEYVMLTVHWDHESGTSRRANAYETAAEVRRYSAFPSIVVGDFNSDCRGSDVSTLAREAGMNLIGNAGIDCILVKGFSGSSQTFSAAPSDHPGLDAALSVQ